MLHLKSIADFSVSIQSTPLHCSASNGHVDVSKLLISSKADVDARNSKCDPLYALEIIV
jgi:ankyrin repeat protein